MLAASEGENRRLRCLCWWGSLPLSCILCRKFSELAKMSSSLSKARIAGTLTPKGIDVPRISDGIYQKCAQKALAGEGGNTATGGAQGQSLDHRPAHREIRLARINARRHPRTVARRPLADRTIAAPVSGNGRGRFSASGCNQCTYY